MKLIKLFEQWVSEEDAVATPPATAEPAKPASDSQTPGSYKLSIKTDTKSFEVEGTSSSEFSSTAATSFTVTSSTEPSIKTGAIIMISPKADKAGDFDIVAMNDMNKPEEAQVYSGKVEKTQA